MGQPSRGKLFPKHRADLLEAAVVTQRMQDGLIEATRYPRNPLDVAAQQVVAMVAMDDWPVADLAAVLAAAPGIVVVDEAYGEFSNARSAAGLLGQFPDRLVVCRTMSKAFAFAGGRLGYLAAAPAVVDALLLVRLPYHLSAVTQAVARVALQHADELLARVDDLRLERDRTVAWLRAQGLTVADSDANYALFGTFADRHAVWQGLLDRGVLIRETGPDGWLRVSVGTPEEMTVFEQALTEVLQ